MSQPKKTTVEIKLLTVFDVNFFESGPKIIFLSHIYSENSALCIRRKAKGVIKVTKFFTTSKQRSLTARIEQALNLLMLHSIKLKVFYKIILVSYEKPAI